MSIYGQSDNWMIERVFLQRDVRDIAREFFVPTLEWDPVTKRYERRMPGSGTGISAEKAELVFSELSATPFEWASVYFRPTLTVRVDATVLNASERCITASSMPQLFCVETGDAISCSMEMGELRPHESATVTYTIVARDAYKKWLILQSGKDPSTDRFSFTGLDSLAELITAALQKRIDDLRPTLEEYAKDMDINPDIVEYLLNGSYFVMDHGECFHTDWLCGNAYHGTPIRARDAYYAGYRPCMKCVGTDWWLSHASIPYGNVYWLDAMSGESVVAWSESTSPEGRWTTSILPQY